MVHRYGVVEGFMLNACIGIEEDIRDIMMRVDTREMIENRYSI